jgi:hypothetical protein
MKSSDLAGSRSWQSASLPGRRDDVERALAAGQVARLAGGFAGGGGLDDLADDGLGLGGCSSNQRPRFSLTTFSTTGRTSDETSLSLVCDENLGSGTLTESTQVRPSRAVVAGERDLFLLGDAGCLGIAVDLARQRGAEAGRCVPPSRCGMLLVKHSIVLVVAVVPLQRDDRR